MLTIPFSALNFNRSGRVIAARSATVQPRRWGAVGPAKTTTVRASIDRGQRWTSQTGAGPR